MYHLGYSCHFKVFNLVTSQVPFDMVGDSLCRLNIDILGGVTILPIAEVPAKSLQSHQGESEAGRAFGEQLETVGQGFTKTENSAQLFCGSQVEYLGFSDPS